MLWVMLEVISETTGPISKNISLTWSYIIPESVIYIFYFDKVDS